MSIPLSIKEQACEGLLHGRPKKTLAENLEFLQEPFVTGPFLFRMDFSTGSADPTQVFEKNCFNEPFVIG